MDAVIKNIERYEFKPGLSVEFEIIKLEELYRSGRELLTVPHRTDFYHILWFWKDSNTHLVDFQPVEIQANTILFLGKHKIHQFENSSDQDGLAILFTDDFFCKTEEQTRLLHSTNLFNDLIAVSKVRVIGEDNMLKDVLASMEKELMQPSDLFKPDILRNLLHNFLLLSERESREQNHSLARSDVDLDYVISFKGLLETNYTKFKQVGTYAKQLYITEKRLNQATSKTLGKSPKQLIDERIVLESKRLLVYTKESVKEIGFKLGFEEPTNFVKYFKKHCLHTPTEFRDSFRRSKSII